MPHVAYKGTPPRPWMRVELIAPDGQTRVIKAVADTMIFGYSSDQVADAIQGSSPDFEGLVGLPLLRRLEYGGDAHHFWVR